MTPPSKYKKHAEDIVFLNKLSAASKAELVLLKINHSGKNAPLWKKVAIQRAIDRKK